MPLRWWQLQPEHQPRLVLRQLQQRVEREHEHRLPHPFMCLADKPPNHGTGSRAPLGEDKQFRERVSTPRKRRWKARTAKRRIQVPVKRAKNLFEPLISDENLSRAIDEVNRTHHWRTHHRPNKCTAWVEETGAHQGAAANHHRRL